MGLATSTIWLFDILGKEELESLVRSDESRGTEPEKRLCCAMCRFPITSPRYRIKVQGGCDHTFSNPDGLRFHIGCFCSAEGCIGSGEDTGKWSWFAGYSWKYALCANCGAQLGWLYRGDEGCFYGLILKRLVAAGEA